MSAVPKAYSVPRATAPVDLYLDGNEGRGPDPEFAARVLGGLGGRLARYPDASELTARFAERFGVERDRVLVTAGGDDGLDRICRVALRGGGALILPRPGFEMVARYTALAGGELVEVPWPTERYPTEAVLAAITPRTRAVVVTSPNNPTGGVATAGDLERLAARVPWLIVDLAYAEFADTDLTEAALALPNAVVIRTLSKAWGLAGARVGVLLGAPDRIAALAAAGAPYAVSGPSLLLAAERLRTGEPEMRAAVAMARTERDRIEERLTALGARVRPSQGNFAFAEVPDPLWLRDAMASLGIAIRAFPGVPGLERAVRISCPLDPVALDRLLAALETALAPEAWLFDIDGVLAEVSGSYREAIRGTAAAFGVRVEPEEIARAKAAGDANNDWVLTRRLLAGRGVEVPLEAVTESFERLYQGTDEAPGLRERETLRIDPQTLFRWASERPLAAVTGRPRADAERFLARFGIRACFQAVICMEDAPAKPSPEPVLRALEALGVGSAWMFGDTPDDLRAARGAGVVGIGIAPEAEARPLLDAGAARVIAIEEASELGQAVPVAAPEPCPPSGRIGEFARTTAETSVEVRVDLDGTGTARIRTGIGMLDHLLGALAKHGRLDLEIRCTGDLEVDDHHTAEDVALAVGTAIDRALGERRGIARFGSAMAPLDEALARAVLDLSGRPWPEVRLELRRERLGGLATENVGHVLNSLAIALRATLHVDLIRGDNDHHRAEAAFKAVALALRQAAARDGDQIPSTKGVL